VQRFFIDFTIGDINSNKLNIEGTATATSKWSAFVNKTGNRE